MELFIRNGNYYFKSFLDKTTRVHFMEVCGHSSKFGCIKVLTSENWTFFLQLFFYVSVKILIFIRGTDAFIQIVQGKRYYERL